MPQASNLLPFSPDVKVALNTGSATRIGKATAQVLAECGTTIIINHFSQAELANSNGNELRERSLDAAVIESDVTSEFAETK